MSMTRLEELKFAVNNAVLEAMDAKLTELLPELASAIGKRCWVTDKMLPRLLPYIEATVEAALREIYDLLPESLDVDPVFVAKTRQQLTDSLARVAALKQTQTL